MREEIFTRIYEAADWGVDSTGKGFSGPGSTQESTHAYVDFLQKYIREKGIRRVIDIGCGDWTFSQHVNWAQVEYLGIDVVKSVVQKNQQRFGSKQFHFLHGDFFHLELPPADLLLCKDVLQHLCHEEISQFFQKAAKHRHCLVTNDIDILGEENNQMAPCGGYRPLDLRAPPFNIPGRVAFRYYDGHTFKHVLDTDRVTKIFWQSP